MSEIGDLASACLNRLLGVIITSCEKITYQPSVVEFLVPVTFIPAGQCGITATHTLLCTTRIAASLLGHVNTFTAHTHTHIHTYTQTLTGFLKGMAICLLNTWK